MFEDLNYYQYCQDNNLPGLLNFDLKEYGDPKQKKEKNANTEFNRTPFSLELDDLIRLHYIARKRKVTTILEFGMGKSTIVFADSLQKNKKDYEEFVAKNLRRNNPFELHSVDNNKDWVAKCQKDMPKELTSFAYFYQTEVRMTTFNDRICTLYDKIPNVAPDLIYLDGPSQFGVSGEINGITTEHKDRLPMSGDILKIEPFLLPGTLIIVDGRTANARFLLNNLQRKWDYKHYQDYDIHTLELNEEPLGKFNKAQIDFANS